MIRPPAPSHGKGFSFRPRKHGVPFFEGNFRLPNHHQRNKNPEKSSNYTYLSSNNFLEKKQPGDPGGKKVLQFHFLTKLE